MNHNTMAAYEIGYAQEHFEELYQRAIDGEEVIIAVDGVPKARLERKWKKRVRRRSAHQQMAGSPASSNPIEG